MRRAGATAAAAGRGRAPERSCGQHELETASPARLGAKLDAAAQGGCELVRDREAETGARVVARPERTEDPLAFLRRHARPAVVDGNRDTAVRGRQLELDLAAVRCPAKRI